MPSAGLMTAKPGVQDDIGHAGDEHPHRARWNRPRASESRHRVDRQALAAAADDAAVLADVLIVAVADREALHDDEAGRSDEDDVDGGVGRIDRQEAVGQAKLAQHERVRRARADRVDEVHEELIALDHRRRAGRDIRSSTSEPGRVVGVVRVGERDAAHHLGADVGWRSRLQSLIRHHQRQNRHERLSLERHVLSQIGPGVGQHLEAIVRRWTPGFVPSVVQLVQEQ